MDEAVPATELDSALFELNLLHNSADINSIKTQAINCQVQNFINQRANYIVPPNTPVKLPMQLNPRYISKIYSSPRRMPNRVPPMRMRPYYIPERPRTKSENADPTSTLYQETTSIVDSLSYSMMDTCDNLQQTIEFNYDKKLNRNNLINLNNNNNNNNNNNTNTNNNNTTSSTTVTSSNKILLKKSKSLEDIRVENLNGAASSHEMEFMSSRIQKLKVQE